MSAILSYERTLPHNSRICKYKFQNYCISCSNSLKRGVEKNSANVISNPSHIFFTVESVMFLRLGSSTLSVSYTHLDVYKRQGVESATTKSHQGARCICFADPLTAFLSTTIFYNYGEVKNMNKIIYHKTIWILCLAALLLY